VLFLGIDDPLLSEELCLAGTTSEIQELRDALVSLYPGRPLLNTAMNLIFRELVPRRGRVQGPLGPGCRYLRDLPERLNCSMSSLGKASHGTAVDLSRILKWSLFLRGLILKERSQKEWSSIARDIGFSGGSAWSAFVQRNFGFTPTQAARVSIESWVQMFRDDVLPETYPQATTSLEAEPRTEAEAVLFPKRPGSLKARRDTMDAKR
jgi:hypothetical protein